MNITEYIIKESGLSVDNEPSNKKYKMFNTGGVECEVGEFLYSLVRMLKPMNILETGTHYGISSTYMALGLKHNNLGGKITTIDPTYYSEAKNIHAKLDILNYINQIELHAEKYEASDKYDIILLDSEPILRFSEFQKFYGNLVDGGIIIIHDLHPHLSYGVKNPDCPEFLHWPYGDFRPTLEKHIKNHDIQVVSFSTPRGITMFQKKKDNMSYIKLLKGEI